MRRALISNACPMEKRTGFSCAVSIGPYVSVDGTPPEAPTAKPSGSATRPSTHVDTPANAGQALD